MACKIGMLAAQLCGTWQVCIEDLRCIALGAGANINFHSDANKDKSYYAATAINQSVRYKHTSLKKQMYAAQVP